MRILHAFIIVTMTANGWIIESLPSIDDGNDIIKGCNITAVGGGSSDTIQSTGSATIMGDFVIIINHNNGNNGGIDITSIAIIDGITNSYLSNDLLSCTSSVTTDRIIIIGGHGDDTITATASSTSNFISICGDTCAINDSFQQGQVQTSVVNSLYDISYGIHGSDTITLTGSSSSVIIGGGGQLDTIQDSGTYAICGDHCLSELSHVFVCVCFLIK
jgi:hypothetical protein